MLNISLKNYRAFAEADLTLRPINIVMGTNGSGKTSLLQFFMLLTQSERLNLSRNKSALNINGDLCSFGQIQNLFFAKNEESDLQFSFSIPIEEINKIVEKIIKMAIEYYEKEIEDDLSFLEFMKDDVNVPFSKQINDIIKLNKKSLSKKNGNLSRNYEGNIDLELTYKAYDSIKENYRLIHQLINDIESDQANRNPETRIFQFLRKIPQSRMLRGTGRGRVLISGQDLDLTSEFIRDLTSHSRSATVSYTLNRMQKTEHTVGGANEAILIVKSFSLLFDADNNSKKEKINFITFVTSTDKEYKSYVISSDLPKYNFFNHYEYTRNKLFSPLAPIFNNFSSGDRIQWTLGNPIFSKTLLYDVEGSGLKLYDDRSNYPEIQLTAKLVSRWLELIEEFLRSAYRRRPITAVKPLRASPRRYYDAHGSDSRDDGSDMLNLFRGEDYDKNFINKWFSRFNVGIDAETFEGYLGKIITRKKLLDTDVDIDLIDSGFGYSQVIPILYKGVTAHKDSLFIVEQPEIHLHPKMQAELADFFIDLYNLKREEQRGRFTMIIETHSEYLIKRFSRRLGEKEYQSHDHTAKAPAIADISLWFTELDEKSGGSRIRNGNIGSSGEIDWPKGFFDTRNEDLKALINNKIREI
jgi:predicted ATPase